MLKKTAIVLSFCLTIILMSAEKPNIILIMSDDMGISDIGCYGSEIKTPVLDKLAENGLRMKQFYNTGRCCPTRGSLLTGLYPHQAGIGHMMNDRGLATSEEELRIIRLIFRVPRSFRHEGLSRGGTAAVNSSSRPTEAGTQIDLRGTGSLIRRLRPR